MIELTDEYILGAGNDRVCYKHPLDPTLCIKITKPPRISPNGQPRKKGPARRVAREVKYYKKLQRRGYDFKHVAVYHGCVETDRGTGHVYELLVNYDGSAAKELEELVHQESILTDELRRAMIDLYDDLYLNTVPLAELHLGNICCVYNAEGSCTMKLVDGIGNSDFIKYCDWSKFLMRKKLLRKFIKAVKYLAKVNPEIAEIWPIA